MRGRAPHGECRVLVQPHRLNIGDFEIELRCEVPIRNVLVPRTLQKAGPLQEIVRTVELGKIS